MKKERWTLKGVEAKIAGFLRENRRMPTYAEMIKLLGVRSKSVVHFWVQKLLKAGLLTKDDGGFLETGAERPFFAPRRRDRRRFSGAPCHRSGAPAKTVV